MRFVKRATTSIIRKPFKTLLLFLLVILLGTVVSSSMIIENALQNTLLNLELRLPIVVTVTEDIDTLREKGYTTYEMRQGLTGYLFDPIPSHVIREIGNLPYVRYFDYSITSGAWSDAIGVSTPNAIFDVSDLISVSARNNFRITGVSREEPLQLENGLFELIAGRYFLDEEIRFASTEVAPVIIPEHFAHLNNFSLGSIFSLYIDYFELPDTFETIPENGFDISDIFELHNHPYNVWTINEFKFEVIGIARINNSYAVNSDDFFMQLLIENSIFTPNWRTEEINRSSRLAEYNLTTVFNLEAFFDVQNITFNVEEEPTMPYWQLYGWEYFDDFRIAAAELLPSLWIIEDLSDVLSNVSSSTNVISGLASQIRWFTLVAMLIVLSLLIILYLHDRRHEIGIYLALGERKGKIVSQILLEVMTVSVLGLVVAVAIGNLIAPQVSREMLLNELSEERVLCQTSACWSPPNSLEFGGFGRMPTISETMEVFEISFSPEALLLFYTTGLVTVLISTIIPIVYILELNPKEILMSARIE